MKFFLDQSLKMPDNIYRTTDDELYCGLSRFFLDGFFYCAKGLIKGGRLVSLFSKGG